MLEGKLHCSVQIKLEKSITNFNSIFQLDSLVQASNPFIQGSARDAVAFNPNWHFNLALISLSDLVTTVSQSHHLV